MSTPPENPSSIDDFYLNFDPKMEALQELSNIGVGHAATALSQLLNRKVDMSIPRLNIVEFNEITSVLANGPEEIYAGIYVSTQEGEDSQLNLLLIMSQESVETILSILRTQNEKQDLTQLDEISKSIVIETGNILLLHTISAINSFTESHWFPSVPDMAIDMIGALVDEVLVKNVQYEDGNLRVLLVECDVFTDDGEKVKGDILLLPNENGLQTLMNRLYGEGWEVMME